MSFVRRANRPVTVNIKDHASIPGWAEEGRELRRSVIEPALEKALAGATNLIVELDGTAGYSCDFLRELFGGLVVSPESAKLLRRVIEIRSDEEPYLVKECWGYVDDADIEWNVPG